LSIVEPYKRSVVYLSGEFRLLAIGDTNDTRIFSAPIAPIFLFHYSIITIMSYCI